MYKFQYSKTNHTATIMNNETKGGITMILIGEEMALFLAEIVKQANGGKDSVSALLSEHRKNAVITCDPTCFCWEVEAHLTKMESVKQVKEGVKRYLQL